MLQELRQKPKHVREKYAFWSAFMVTAVIAVVWGLSLSLQFGAFEEATLVEEKTAEPESSGAFSRSFSDVKNNVAGAWNAFKDSKEASDGTASTTEPVPESVSEVGTTTVATSSKSEEPSFNNKRSILIATTSVIMESSNE